MIEDLKEFKKGESLIVDGNFTKAITYFESILKKSEYTPSFYKLYYKIGQCNYLMGCSSNTIESFQRAKQFLIKAKAFSETNYQPFYLDSINDLLNKVEIEINKFPH